MQAMNNHEIIVVDSCSTDNTEELLTKEYLNDTKVIWFKQDERTPYGVSWLEGWRIARGNIVANSNTDDRSHPWRSLKVIDAATSIRRRDAMLRVESPGYFYYGGYETVRDNQVVARGVPPHFSVDDFKEYFRCGVHIHWDNKIRERVDWGKMFDAAYKLKSAFDYWLVLYFISLGVRGVNISNCFSIYNQRDDSIEQSDKLRNTYESLYAIESFFPQSNAIQRMYRETGDFLDGYLDFKKELDR